jgi:hemolysin III
MKIAAFAELSVEELANTITHGAGLVLSIVGFAVLLLLAILNGDAWHITSSIVYGTSLVVLYAASTLYHSSTTPHRKSFLQLLDHCCIYVLIAGSYTPFLLVVVRNGFGMGMLAFVWAIAVFGIMMKVMYRDRLKALGIVLYLAMGWLALAVVQPMYSALGLTPMILIVAGGLSYTAGMIFFGWKSIKHHHAIFHVFVLGGSILHYIVIAAYIVGRVSA